MPEAARRQAPRLPFTLLARLGKRSRNTANTPSPARCIAPAPRRRHIHSHIRLRPSLKPPPPLAFTYEQLSHRSTWIVIVAIVILLLAAVRSNIAAQVSHPATGIAKRATLSDERRGPSSGLVLYGPASSALLYASGYFSALLLKHLPPYHWIPTPKPSRLLGDSLRQCTPSSHPDD